MWRPSQFGATHAGTDPFDDQVTFQLGDRTEDDNDGAAQRAGRVDVFAEADELDAETAELVQHFQIMANRTGDAVPSPDHHHVKLAAASVCHELIEAGTLSFGAADPVSVFVNDLQPSLLGKGMQIVALGFGMLVDGRNTQVQRRALHCLFSAMVSKSASALPAHSGSGSSSGS